MHGEVFGCSKCGWIFPNPHPSAKQRRAHKKVCGKIQGFQISEVETNVSNPSDNMVLDNVGDEGVIGRQVSNKSEDDEFKDASAEFGDVGGVGLGEQEVKAVDKPDVDGTTASSNSPTRNHPVHTHTLEDEMQADSHQDHGSKSTMHSKVESVSDNAGGSLVTESTDENILNTEAATNLYPENTLVIDNYVDSRQVMDKEGSGDETVSTFEASANKTTSESPEIDVKLQKLEGCSGGEVISDFDDSRTDVILDAEPTEGLLDSKEKDHALGLMMSQDELWVLQNDEAPNVKEEEDSLSTLQPEDIPVEELSEATVKETKDHELMESGLDVKPDSCEAIDEVVDQLQYSEVAHLSCLSSKTGESADGSAAQGLENTLEHEEMGCTFVVEGQENNSLANDTVTEVVGANGIEALADDTTNGMTSLQIEAKQIRIPCEEQELEYPQRENKILPENCLVIEAGEDTMASPTKSLNLKPDDAVISAETRVEDSDIALSCIGKPIEEIDTITTPGYPQGSNCASEDENAIKETGCDSNTIVDSTETCINGSHLGNMIELSHEQILQTEKNQEGSDELELSENVDFPSSNKTEVQYESVDMNKFAPAHPHEETKTHSGEVGIAQDSAENHQVNEVLVENGGAQDKYSEGVSGHVSEVHRQLLQENGGHNIVKQQSDAPILSLDGSVDSSSQADTMEGFAGSVSDGTNHSVKDSANMPSIRAVEAQPETVAPVPNESVKVAELNLLDDPIEAHNFNSIYEAPVVTNFAEPVRGEDQSSAHSEILTVQKPHQPNLSSSQAGALPSVTHNVKKEIVGKATNCSSEKEHTPLGSLLVEANIESKQKVRSIKNHIDKPSTLAQVIQASENVDEPQYHMDADRAKAEKEWNSPARLPTSREKRKVRYWTPFVCCSSIN